MFEEETILAPQRPETWRKKCMASNGDKTWFGKSWEYWESLKMATKDGPRGLIFVGFMHFGVFQNMFHTDSYLQVI